MFIQYSGLKIDPNIDKQTYDLLNPHLELDAKFKELSDVLWELGGEQDFINKHYAIIDGVANILTKSDKYKEWVNHTLTISQPKITTRNVNVYQEQNHDSYFISIDIKSANYQILHLNGLINETWSDFLNQFTPHAYYHKSKFLRLKCLSHTKLLPKKQQKAWKNIIVDVLNAMIDNIIITQSDNLAALNSDEIIINSNDIESEYLKYQRYLSTKFPHLILSVNLFKLNKIGKYYVQIDPFTDTLKFKCVNAKEMPELIIAYNQSLQQ